MQINYRDSITPGWRANRRLRSKAGPGDVVQKSASGKFAIDPLEARFWIAWGWPTIQEKYSPGGSVPRGRRRMN